MKLENRMKKRPSLAELLERKYERKVNAVKSAIEECLKKSKLPTCDKCANRFKCLRRKEWENLSSTE